MTASKGIRFVEELITDRTSDNTFDIYKVGLESRSQLHRHGQQMNCLELPVHTLVSLLAITADVAVGVVSRLPEVLSRKEPCFFSFILDFEEGGVRDGLA